MSFTDPVTVAARSPTPALTLSRVSVGAYKSSFLDLTNNYAFSVEHSDPSLLGKKQERHYAKLVQTKDVTLPSGSVASQSATASFSVSIPPYGWTNAQKQALFLAMLDCLLEGEVTLARWIGFES
jgi:hypothetical protein